MRKHQRHWAPRSSGFTIIELVVAIAILAIIVSMAAPSFSSTIANQRAKNSASSLYAALLQARSEALTRNMNISLSPKSGSWNNGWQILTSSGALVLDIKSPSNVSITGPASLVYRPNGVLTAAPGSAFVVTATSGTASSTQCVSVDLSGRPYTKTGSSC